MKTLLYFFGLISLCLSIHIYSSLPLSCIPGNGLTTIFYPKPNFKEPASAIEITPYIDFFPDLAQPHPNVTNVDLWSIYYSGVFTPNKTGSYIFIIESDDGGRINLDGERNVGSFNIQNFPLTMGTPITLDEGHPYLFSVDYYENRIHARIRVSVYSKSLNVSTVIPPYNLEPCDFVPEPTSQDCSLEAKGLWGYYYNLKNFEEFKFSRIDSNLKFDWGYDTPDPSLTNPDSFSIVWKGSFTVLQSGRYRIGVNSIDDIKVKISNIVVINNSIDQNFMKTGPIMQLVSGKYYYIEIYYQDTNVTATFELVLSHLGLPGSIATPIPSSQLRACIPHGIVSPQRVSISGLPSVAFPVTLRTQPDGNVTVTLSMPNSTTATPCVLYFDENNWDIPQYVRVISTKTTDSVTFTGSSLDNNYNGTTSKTFITGEYVPCGKSQETATCNSWGDPHLMTFDKFSYDFQSHNDFYMVRSLNSDFVVQVRQDVCGSNTVACNYAVAIKYSNSIIIVVISSVTGTPVVFSNPETALLGKGFSMSQVGNEFNFNYPSGANVKVVTIWWAKGRTYYMNAIVTLPVTYLKTVRGICGNFDKNSKNDLHDKSGAPVNLTTFIEEWIVPSSENMITGGFSAAIPPLPGAGGAGPSEPICSYPVCEVVNNTNPYNNTPPTPPPCPSCGECNLTTTVITNYCKSIFLTSNYAIECGKLGINITSFYLNCILDVTEMCDLEAAVPTACSFQLACSNSPAPQCACLCNLHGVCVENGKCDCIDGFLDDGCGTNPNNTPCAIAVTPLTGKIGDFVLVSASNLVDGHTVQCKFGNEITNDAVMIDPFTVRCKVPPGSGTVQVIILDNGKGDNCDATFIYIDTSTTPTPTPTTTTAEPTPTPTTTTAEPTPTPTTTTTTTAEPTPTIQPGFDCKLIITPKIAKAGDFILVQNENLNVSYPFSCKFGDTIVPAEIVTETIIRCQVPPGTGVVPFYVIQGIPEADNCTVPFTYEECPSPPLPPSQCEESQFGFEASLFNAIIFKDMSESGNVGGRLAVGDNLVISYSSIGDDIFPAKTCDEMDISDWKYALVVGGKISWSQIGSVSYGSIAYGKETTSIPVSVLTSLSDGCQVLNLDVLDFDYIELYLKTLSSFLSTMTPTGKVVYNFGLFLTPSGKTDYEVFDVSSAEVQNPFITFSFDTSTLSPTATIIINVSGNSCGFSGSYDTLIPVRNRVLWNFYECTSLSAVDVDIHGSVLAPYADFPGPEGNLYGQVFAKSWCGGMDIFYIPFEACLPLVQIPL